MKKLLFLIALGLFSFLSSNLFAIEPTRIACMNDSDCGKEFKCVPGFYGTGRCLPK